MNSITIDIKNTIIDRVFHNLRIRFVSNNLLTGTYTFIENSHHNNKVWSVMVGLNPITLKHNHGMFDVLDIDIQNRIIVFEITSTDGMYKIKSKFSPDFVFITLELEYSQIESK